METRTYYDILGVSPDAAFEEITNAKNALAKVYHPDANIGTEIDTTLYMQEILEAYQVLSNPQKREQYNQRLTGTPRRVFRTYTVKKADKADNSSHSFVAYWNAACHLNEIVTQSKCLLELSARRESLGLRLFKRLGQKGKEQAEIAAQLNNLCLQAIRYIALLREADIPMSCWQPEAMNWVLIRWGQRQSMDYHVLFSKYEAYVEQTSSNLERSKLRSKNKHFHSSLKKLLRYASE